MEGADLDPRKLLDGELSDDPRVWLVKSARIDPEG